MKRQATVIALGAALIAAMTAPSFATQAKAHHAKTHAQLTPSYSGYYDSTVPEGNYTTYANPASGSVSSAIGNIGR
jgi:hypothetical protein